MDDILACTAQFYDQLLVGSGNVKLNASLNRLLTRIMVLRAGTMAQAGRWQHSLMEMQAIMQAISSRNSEAARKACIAHVHAASAVALSSINKPH